MQSNKYIFPLFLFIYFYKTLNLLFCDISWWVPCVVVIVFCKTKRWNYIRREAKTKTCRAFLRKWPCRLTAPWVFKQYWRHWSNLYAEHKRILQKLYELTCLLRSAFICGRPSVWTFDTNCILWCQYANIFTWPSAINVLRKHCSIISMYHVCDVKQTLRRN